MAKETNLGTNKGFLGITAAGAAEGAAIGLVLPLMGGPVAGGVVGGATALSAELVRRKLKTRKDSQQVTAIETLTDPNTLVDVTVATTSMTKRTDVPEDQTQPIVKSNTEQAASVSVQDLPNTLASMHARTLANAFPTWETTLQEKTIASATNTSAYEHRPQRIQ